MLYLLAYFFLLCISPLFCRNKPYHYAQKKQDKLVATLLQAIYSKQAENSTIKFLTLDINLQFF
ncbi:MAG: hypothetical protein D3916_02725 [Candidatus Electrothrix sp. MAN1_4]|nr:hypothetical protein [Candidatus Electrothrix sp. MAN1_4]